MSIMARFQLLGRSWLAIRHAAGEAIQLSKSVSEFQLKHGFNGANAEEVCEDTDYEHWIDLCDRFQAANRKLTYLIISAEDDSSFALISRILTKVNVRNLS
ncbi:MAG: hypothetical protein JKX71_07990 [Amylibacter sp.]|nr:hypothetical protein [Amylibacter sp.]